MPDVSAWADAFARQAASDFLVYEHLAGQGDVIPACHRLHYLHMSGEKIAKAHMLRSNGADIAHLRSTHCAFATFIRRFAEHELRGKFGGRSHALRSQLCDIEVLAREVERLAPSVDRDNRPANAEYPWEEHDRVIAPCDCSYPLVEPRLRSPLGRDLLGLLRSALARYHGAG